MESPPPLEERAESAGAVSIEPAAIFLPKFENAGEMAKAQYLEIESAGGRILVASVKSSGSLWLLAGTSQIICSSKNG
jgi:hypothetical protein